MIRRPRPQHFKAWEKHMSVREAVPASTAAISREIARRIGPERMQEWLDRLGYGNRHIGPVTDRFPMAR
jgi:beta-lactamase class D